MNKRKVFDEIQSRIRAGRFLDALPLIEKGISSSRANSDLAQFHVQQAVALRGLSQMEGALAAVERAIALDESMAEAHHLLGNLLKSLRRFGEAVVPLKTAAALAPRSAPIWLNLGVTLLETRDRRGAIDAFRRAIELEPSRADSHNILGHALASCGENEAARLAFQHALKLRPNLAAAHNNLARLEKSEGRMTEAIAHYCESVAAEPSPGSHSNLLFALNYLPEIDPATVFAEHRRWNGLYAAKLAPNAPPVVQPLEGRRLRVGYISPDYLQHSVAYFIEPVLAEHDRARFEVFSYSDVHSPDHVTHRLRGFSEHWRDIAGLGDSSVADLIRSDRIDLLVELAGHTAHNRLLVMARRPAPVQLTWIGYPNTTGLDTIDYRLTDAISDPVGVTDLWHSEKLVRMPANFSCYRPDPSAPAVNVRPASKPGAVTFGCFNNFAKVTPEVLGLWASLMSGLPESKLLLKSNGLGDPGVMARVRRCFEEVGVAGERIAFHSVPLSVADHLGLYHEVDVALDPFPYNGTTTTCEALWMGVPVVTLAGQTHAARVGASLMTHVGLPDWIASTHDDYLRIAEAAALDVPRRSALRADLRERMRGSPLCDALRFTRDLESTFLSLFGFEKSQ